MQIATDDEAREYILLTWTLCFPDDPEEAPIRHYGVLRRRGIDVKSALFLVMEGDFFVLMRDARLEAGIDWVAEEEEEASSEELRAARGDIAALFPGE